jgi:nucleotide-binding universal stress UspA family protein
MDMFLRAENTDRKDERMEQAGSQPRPDNPDRADSSGRSPGQGAQDLPEREPARQPSPEDHPVHTPGAREPAHPVVIGYDGSPSSRNALAYAAGLARRLAQPLLIVYVVSFGVYCEPMTGQVICAVRERGELESWLQAEFDQVCDREGLEVRVIARRGNAARELAATVSSSNADALVVGAPGHRLHHLAGSIPSWLARHARCPVIVVP